MKEAEVLKKDLYYDLLYKYSELKMMHDDLIKMHKRLLRQNLVYRNTFVFPQQGYEIYNKGLKDALSSFKKVYYEQEIDIKKIETLIKEKKL